jgi:hypothetical protein
MPRLSDTSPEALQVLTEIQRRMSMEMRWEVMRSMTRAGRVFHAAGYRSRHPNATDEEIARDWVRQHVGAEFVGEADPSSVLNRDLELTVIRHSIAVLGRLGIGYAVGGSWASCLFGDHHYTYNLDLMVEPFPGQEEVFATEFRVSYAFRPEELPRAVAERRSFSILHKPSGFTVHVFVRQDRPFEDSVMKRRWASNWPNLSATPIMVVSAEDIILLKLEWWHLGKLKSEQQWRDVLGVLRVRADALDHSYLNQWATELGVSGLLECARAEAPFPT